MPHRLFFRPRRVVSLALLFLISIALLLGLLKLMQVTNFNFGRSAKGELTREEQIQRECFEKVGKITEKDATRFNEFRSLSDFRLFKYKECLNNTAP